MSIAEVARRYSKALLSLTKQNGHHLRALEELRAIHEIIHKDEAIQDYFQNPLISPDQKLKVVKVAFGQKGLLEEVFNVLVLLAERHRLPVLDDVITSFQEEIDKEEGITRGVVRAARPLSGEAQQALEARISSTLKKKIVLTFKEDPSILGGVIADVGGWTFDDSLENHLRKLNEDLNRSAE